VVKSRLESLLSVAAACWRSSVPLQVSYYRSAKMRQLVEAALRGRTFDAAYVHLFRMAPYLRPGQVRCPIVDLTDVISREIARSLPHRGLPGRWVYGTERRRVERFERQIAGSGAEIWVISDAERDALLELCPAARVRVVPNGVDCARFHPVQGVEDESLLLFTGHMGVAHNVDAAVYLVERILPEIRRSSPTSRVRVVGACPSRRVRLLARRDGVEVTGWVEDLNSELNRAAVFIAPLRFQAGVQNKVLEALAAGRPVVTTPEVARAIGARDGEQLLVGSDAAGLARQTSMLLADRERRRNLGAAGRSFVAAQFTWKPVVDRAREIASRVVDPPA
jgi:glycosyltransferase involved in cell wall biosynthesis